MLLAVQQCLAVKFRPRHSALLGPVRRHPALMGFRPLITPWWPEEKSSISLCTKWLHFL